MKRNLKWILGALAMAVATALSVCPAHADAVEFDGLIEPWQVVNIGAPVEGIVEQVAVDRSSTVTQGEVLVKLDATVERAAFDKAQAMTSFVADKKLKEAQLSFAKRAHQRVKRLKAVSTHDKDQAATEVALTRFRLGKARENIDLGKLELKKARAMLDRRTIRSPIDGVVVERYVSPGEYVNNQPLLRVAQIDPLRVEVILPASLFGRILPGMTANVVPELPGYSPQAATVTIVDRVIDSASNTFGVRLQLPNTEQQMPSGLKCIVRFEMAGEKNKFNKKTARIVAGQARKKNINN